MEILRNKHTETSLSEIALAVSPTSHCETTYIICICSGFQLTGTNPEEQKQIENITRICFSHLGHMMFHWASNCQMVHMITTSLSHWSRCLIGEKYSNSDVSKLNRIYCIIYYSTPNTSFGRWNFYKHHIMKVLCNFQ